MSYTLPLNHTPAISVTTNGPTTGSGSYVIDLSNVHLGSLQLNATWDSSDTTTVTLKCSNDDINFVGFSTAKTLSVSGTTNGLFELGVIDYRYLQVNWSAPGSGNNLTLVGTFYAAPNFTIDA
jgi:hypothetical protein